MKSSCGSYDPQPVRKKRSVPKLESNLKEKYFWKEEAGCQFHEGILRKFLVGWKIASLLFTAFKRSWAYVEACQHLPEIPMERLEVGETQLVHNSCRKRHPCALRCESIRIKARWNLHFGTWTARCSCVGAKEPGCDVCKHSPINPEPLLRGRRRVPGFLLFLKALATS